MWLLPILLGAAVSLWICFLDPDNRRNRR